MKKSSAKKRERKFAKIQKLWEEARLFRPDQHEGLHFLCPVCRAIHEVANDLIGIDNAHIVPEAAGGKRTTVLCKKCNNEFGADQDRWLGDFLKYKGDFFKAFEQEKHFEINGVRFNGRIHIDPDGNMSISVDKKRNPPGTDQTVMVAKASQGFVRDCC